MSASIQALDKYLEIVAELDSSPDFEVYWFDNFSRSYCFAHSPIYLKISFGFDVLMVWWKIFYPSVNLERSISRQEVLEILPNNLRERMMFHMNLLTLPDEGVK